MEEQKDIHGVYYFVKFQASPLQVQIMEYEKQYHLLNCDRIRILQELDHQKGEEYQINRKIMWFSYLDEQIKWKILEIENLEPWNQDTVVDSLGGKDDRKVLSADLKQCRKRLIKNDRIDIKYLQHVEEEHLSSRKSNGPQELDNVIASMVQMIRHGSKKRADEMKIYQQLTSINSTKEMLISRQLESQNDQFYTRELRSKRDEDWKRSLQHKIKIRLEEIENFKRKQDGRTARVRRLKADMEHVRKNISSLNNKLDNVNLEKSKAYKRAYELREQKNHDMDSTYNEYISFKTNARELARKGDVVKLKTVCDMQIEEFMRQWNASTSFRENYQKRTWLIAN